MKNYFILAAVLFLVVGCDSKKEQAKFSGVVHSSNYSQAGIESLKKGDIKEAIASFESAIKQDPKNINNYITLGEIYLHLRNPEVASEIFSVATNIDRNNGEAFYLLGFSRGLNGDREAAIENVKMSVQIFIQEKDQEKLARSVALLKSLTESTSDAQSSIDGDVSKMPEQVLGMPMDKTQGK